MDNGQLDQQHASGVVQTPKEKARQILADAVKEITADQRSHFQDRLYRMIDYAVGRHDWYDEQRNRFLNIGIGLTTGAAAVAALLVQVVKPGTGTSLAIICLWLSILVVFLTGLQLLRVYNESIGRNHPYRKIADIRSWYFIYNLPTGMNEVLSPDSEKAKQQVENVLDNLESFMGRCVPIAKDAKESIKEDLEQVFMLQLLQRYRYQQVKKLSSVLVLGFEIAGALLFFSVIFLWHSLPGI